MSISLHPGNITTDLGRNAGSLMKIAARLMTYPVSYGAITSLYAGTASAAGELNGKVSIPGSRVTMACQLTYKKYFVPVSHRLGTRHASASKGARYRACKETVGMVRRASQSHLGHLTILRLLFVCLSRACYFGYITLISLSCKTRRRPWG